MVVITYKVSFMITSGDAPFLSIRAAQHLTKTRENEREMKGKTYEFLYWESECECHGR
jgi:hypothetical protein